MTPTRLRYGAVIVLALSWVLILALFPAGWVL